MKRMQDARYSYDFERSYDYIWETIVLPSIKLVYDQMDEAFIKAAKLDYAYSDLSEYKKDVKEFYREKREWLKAVYLPHEPNPVLDEHKLGAVWCRTLLAYKPFYFKFKDAQEYVEKRFGGDTQNTELTGARKQSEWFTKNIYCNYRVAFLVSVGIVYLYLVYDCKEKGENVPEYLHDAYDYFVEKKVLRCPMTTQEHSNFETSCIIALQKNDVLQRDFDYLTYAIMLFQLDHYNRMCYYLSKNGLLLNEI